ncbi:hypothetical protein ERX46_07095 [Brumimicrobium glaciale]|uniref:Lipoprotein n=1 Tax=Brumimicrobium glaciale TaxID=200475 RepID=A0A4V1WG17_9FLAO|nr:hypothetical protein [Brumimicrobium glaciale]RYM35136.1 hypothetical protein ERX46_07095 [Brumimicrobium glaciale]
MSLIIRIGLLLIFGFSFFSCSIEKDKTEVVLNELKQSNISGYIDFEKEITFMDSTCLIQFRNSLHKVIWDKDKVNLEYGILFSPTKVENKYYSEAHENKFILFELKKITNNLDSTADTNYMFEAYYLSSYSESMKPCYFTENNTLFVDSIVDISPRTEFLKGNCIMKFTRPDNVPGVFKLYQPDSNEIKLIDSLLP